MKALLLILLLAVSINYCKQSNKKIPYNSCIYCHKENAGLSKHLPISCFFCHKGNSNSFEKIESHKDFIKIPGNLSNVDITCGVCHRDQTSKIHNSLMTTNSGMVYINRLVFGETKFDEKHSNITSLDTKNSPADSYFSQLCASCHLGMEKKHIGALTGYEKGGGCLACHLQYSSKKSHPSNDKPQRETVFEIVKRNILNSMFISNPQKDAACFNCHSRSARISLNYNGLIEMADDDKSKAELVLYDGRKVKKIQEDIHKTKGISCIGCHRATDVMGDGLTHFMSEDAVHTKCESCHKIVENKHHNKNHQRLTCTTCHDAWAPNCFGCHIKYDRNQEGYNHLTEKTSKGRWIEETGELFVKPAVLGVTKDNRIRSFIPGMKLTIDTSGFTGKKEKLIVRNLFTPSFSHTITKKGRDCNSCHKNSYSLGFGEGKLINENNIWKFIPDFQKENGLPQDAWIEPFQEKYNTNDFSVRKNNRPLNKTEQILILEVGKCLACHFSTEDWFLDFNKNKNYIHRQQSQKSK